MIHRPALMPRSVCPYPQPRVSRDQFYAPPPPNREAPVPLGGGITDQWWVYQTELG